MTASEATESYAEYFGGSFRSVNSTVDALSDYCGTEIHILSEKHGYVRGADQVVTDPTVDTEKETKHFAEALLSRIEYVDVVVLLLTTDSFSEIVATNWDLIVENAKKDSIWCIGTSRSGLESVEIDALEKHHTVLLYRRRGVARIGNETREELIDQVRIRAED